LPELFLKAPIKAAKMAPRVLSQNLIFITSANRLSGTPSDFTVSLPNSVLANPWGGRTKVTVVDAILNRCFYSVRSINNKFSVKQVTTGVTTQYTIPYGNYTIQSWQAALGKLLPGWTITHDPTSGLCTFLPTALGIYQLAFQGRSSSLFGFNPGDTPTGTNISGIVSSYPLKLNIDSFINIHHSLPKMFNSSVANYRQQDFQENDVLVRLPCNVPAFANITYQNTRDDFSFYLGNTHVNSLRLYLTSEWYDTLDPFPYDWSLTLRVDYESLDDPEQISIAKLTEMNEKLQYLSLK
jgi:hypothetical protein